MATIPKRSERPAAKKATPKKETEGKPEEAKIFGDPESFLLNVMNDAKMEIRHRLSAASSLMPYHHAKKGEIGKKEREEAKAKEVAKESKFATPKPPAVVNK